MTTSLANKSLSSFTLSSNRSGAKMDMMETSEPTFSSNVNFNTNASLRSRKASETLQKQVEFGIKCLNFNESNQKTAFLPKLPPKLVRFNSARQISDSTHLINDFYVGPDSNVEKRV